MTNIIETERLAIRKLTYDDFRTLCAIMGKPEVMYAWGMASAKMMYKTG